MDDEKLEQLGREVVEKVVREIKPYDPAEAASIVRYLIEELSILAQSLREDSRRSGPNGRR